MIFTEHPDNDSPRASTKRRVRNLTITAIAAIVTVAGVIGFLRSTENQEFMGHNAAKAFAPTDTSRNKRTSKSDEVTFATGTAGGDVPKESTINADIPAVKNLSRELRDALRRASKDAEKSGIVLYINSGWRSPEFQSRLLKDAVATYGSKKEASRWVATAESSAHVKGEAVDIGYWDAMDWLSTYGPRHGLCQIYRNEPWHFEYSSQAAKTGCPPMYDDSTQDPRMKG